MALPRRRFFAEVTAAATGIVVGQGSAFALEEPKKKRPIVTLSFDDGFRKSFLRAAEIYEKHKLSACLNVVAAGLPEDKYIRESPIGDFGLWNELKKRGHEIMPHGYRHENLQKASFDKGKDLWPGQRGLGADSGDLPGAALGPAPLHWISGDSACWQGIGEGRFLTQSTGLDSGASKVIGIEKKKKYLRIAEKRVLMGE